MEIMDKKIKQLKQTQNLFKIYNRIPLNHAMYVTLISLLGICMTRNSLHFKANFCRKNSTQVLSEIKFCLFILDFIIVYSEGVV